MMLMMIMMIARSRPIPLLLSGNVYIWAFLLGWFTPQFAADYAACSVVYSFVDCYVPYTHTV